MNTTREMKCPLFIMAGNGPYDNRGCEAIIRGTVKILRQHFDNPQFIAVSNYRSKCQFEKQKIDEDDEAIIHKKTIVFEKRFRPLWFLLTGLRFLCPTGRNHLVYKNMLPSLKEASAVLSIGGDNYSLDYGIPRNYTGLDDLVLSRKKPMVIWGASVGPFSKIPEYEKYMIKHLKKVNGIFARETATIEYLAEKGITTNVYRIADPAFLMKAIEPKKEKFNIEIPKEAIGINLSPLMAKYKTNTDLKKWIAMGANIVEEIAKTIKLPIFLIPHVTSPHDNDHEFLRNVLALIEKPKARVKLISSNLTAAEIKWVISKMSVFIGARTHSTIAALSSGVPTVSLAYSIKAKGINQDLFGHLRYCLEPEQIVSTTITEKICEVMQESEMIKNQLNHSLPQINSFAMDAGKYLKNILEK